MDDLHLLEDSSSVVGNQHFALGGLDLNETRCRVRKVFEESKVRASIGELSGLTILSMPRGPRLVLTTSATAIVAKRLNMSLERVKLTLGSDDVGLTDVLGLLVDDVCSSISASGGRGRLRVLRHLNLSFLLLKL